MNSSGFILQLSLNCIDDVVTIISSFESSSELIQQKKN